MSDDANNLAASIIRGELHKRAYEATKLIIAQRNEILKAFIAKYGWEPEFTVQVQQGSKWWCERRDPEMTAGELLEAASALNKMGQSMLADRFEYYAKRFEPLSKEQP